MLRRAAAHLSPDDVRQHYSPRAAAPHRLHGYISKPVARPDAIASASVPNSVNAYGTSWPQRVTCGFRAGARCAMPAGIARPPEVPALSETTM